jgi:hypothetical protein
LWWFWFESCVSLWLFLIDFLFEGAFLLSQVATMDVNMAVKFVYPRLYRIHDMSDEVKSQTKFLRFIDTHMITSPLSV